MVDENPSFIEIHDHDGGTRWRFDRAFMSSTWSCIWGRGCQGIHDEVAPELQDGCCSVGAEMIDEDESRRIGVLGMSLNPELFERHSVAEAEGVFSDISRAQTRVTDEGCIFLNRPDFAGGAGCALHLSAILEGEDPLVWKPAVCWQFPFKIDREESVNSDGATTECRTVRAWRRSDWGPGGATMAWCCSDPIEAPEAFAASDPVWLTLAQELSALAGPAVHAALVMELGVED